MKNESEWQGNTPSIWQGLLGDFDRYEQRHWFKENWNVSLYFVAAYVVFIFAGQEYMRNRKPVDLKKPLLLWNSLLAIFSIAACVRILPEFFQILNGKNGFYNSVCASWFVIHLKLFYLLYLKCLCIEKIYFSSDEVTDDSLYWGWLFTLSKVAELGDTVFLVLRKRRVIFLHW